MTSTLIEGGPLLTDDEQHAVPEERTRVLVVNEQWAVLDQRARHPASPRVGSALGCVLLAMGPDTGPLPLAAIVTTFPAVVVPTTVEVLAAAVHSPFGLTPRVRLSGF